MKKKEKVLTELQQELENEVQKQMKEIYDNQDKKVKSTENLRKLIPYYTKYKGLFVGFILIMILYIFVSFLEPVIGAEVLEYLTLKDFDNTLRYALYFLIGGVVLAIIRYILATIRSKLNFYIKFDLRQKMMNSIDRISMSKYDEMNSSVLISRIQTDSANCASTIMQIIDYILNLVKSLVFFLYIAFISISFKWFKLLITFFV